MTNAKIECDISGIKRMNNPVKTIFHIFLTIAVVIVLNGCGSGVAGLGTSESRRAPTEVRLGYFANITHAQALIGVARGDFQKALGPIPLKTFVFNAGPAAIEAMFAGELDVVYVGPGPALNGFVKSGGKILRVVSGAAANGVVIVARKGSGIVKLDDLKGKRIATPQFGNTQDVSARAFVLHQLRDKDKKDGGTTTIETVANAEQLGLFKQGQLDAAWAPEPWGTRLIRDADGVLIEEEKNLWDERKFSTTLIVASGKFIAEHPDVLEAMLKTHVEITTFLNQSPDAAAPIINTELKRIQGKAMDPDVLKEALSRVAFDTDPLPEAIDKLAGWYVELGIIKRKPDLARFVDASILNKLRAK